MSEADRIRVLSVDDHPLLREGIATMINNQPDMVMVGEASTGRDALQQFRKHLPDVTLMDLRLPDMSGIDGSIRVTSGRCLRNCCRASRPVDATPTITMSGWLLI